MGQVRVIGVRHHSPACARLVRDAIMQDQPQAVLIEGPGDFNARIGELLLEHRLPLALYSYANEDGHSAQCWFPFVAYSPEWVALQAAREIGAVMRFIDLPHWRYRAVPDQAAARQHESRPADAQAAQRQPRALPGRSRYAEVTDGLMRRFACDSQDALWDHLFECLPTAGDLSERLDAYFEALRGDDPGSEQDQAREAHMIAWTAWAGSRFERVLVVCGGWHKPAIERAWPICEPGVDEPIVPQPENERAAGSYLVPYAYRQVDALGGYAAGMPSPLYYEWVWTHGLVEAAQRASRQMVLRLRARQVPVSTADLMAMEHMMQGLARLRSHAHPLRVDLLDALQSAVVKEALDSPTPWSERGLLQADHHPVLREALLALTGEAQGQLHADTPLPPLVHDVARRLAACGLSVSAQAQDLVLDRRHPDDNPRAQLLWQLRGLGVSSVKLSTTKAPNAAKSLPAHLHFEEHWRILRNDRWYPDLIEGAVHGATLPAAARACLLQQARDAGSDALVLTRCLMQAVRAGLFDIGDELAAALADSIPRCHDHGALAQAADSLAQVAQTGFWGQDPRHMLDDALALLADRLLWLLEGREGAGSAGQVMPDVAAVKVFDRLLRLALPGIDPGFVLATMVRLCGRPSSPPALRGAALGVAYSYHGPQGLAGGDSEAARAEVLRLMRAVPPRDELGDFLFGLFSCARAVATESDAVAQAMQQVLAGMGHEDFLAALPQLRAAFGWFPSNERALLARHVAALLGLDAAGQHRLLRLDHGARALVDAKAVEAQAVAWARQYGLMP